MHSSPDEERVRRIYWTEQMESAYAFMVTVAKYPVDECGEAMAFLPEVAQEAKIEAAFATTKVGKDRERLFFLREGLIPNFLGAAQEMNSKGWILKVEEAYRSRTIQKELGLARRTFDVILERVLWENKGETPSPEMMFRRLSALIATNAKVGTHMCGSALDISVLRCDGGEEIDRGGSYLEISERTPMDSPFVSSEAQHNRTLITGIMSRHGFVAYPYEFWHYSAGDVYDQHLNDATVPARYGPVDMDRTTGKTTAILSPNDPITSIEEIRSHIKNALARRQ